jgi:membrane-associated phospholipid phosphatase
LNLDPNDINRFDRPATRQDADFVATAQILSDVGLYSSYALPLLLFADPEIRKDWAEILLLYLETEAIVVNLFYWGGKIPVDRIRPIVYNQDIPYADKTYKTNNNSFYSGHTASSAAASFFVAKVYCDYHPELGNKKYIIYSLAVIPPAFTGYFRYKGMKHFPTDVLTGFIVGAGTGLLVPHLHKQKNSNFALVPFTGMYNGIAFSLNF